MRRLAAPPVDILKQHIAVKSEEVLARNISRNALALRHALQSDIVPLKKEAVKTIQETWEASYTVTECAERLGVSRNAMTQLLADVGL